MKKRLFVLALLFILLLPALPAAAETGTVSTINTTNLFDSYRGNGRWSELKTPKHRLNEKYVVYCLQHKKASPKGHRYDLTDQMHNFSLRVRNGLQIILENGYPSNTGGLSASQAEYATTNAIRFWTNECGDPQAYDFTDLSAFSDAQLRQMAADGLIPNKIRVRSASYIPALQFSIDLLIKARSQQFITKDVSLNASDISAERTGDVFAGEAQVSVVNLRGGYVLDTSALPSGSRVSGYTGKDGDTLRISIPASTATEKRTYTLTLTGKDDRARSNMQVFLAQNSDYQRVLAVRMGQNWYTDVVTRTLTVTTGAYSDPRPDLTVTKLIPESTACEAGARLRVQAEIKNQGTKDAYGFFVSLTGDGFSVRNIEIRRLDAGATVPVAFSIPTPSEPGDLVITAFADCEDTIEESNEANNKRSTTVRLEAAPDLAVIEVEPQKEGYNAGETVTIRTVIVNQGNQDAGTFVVRLEADGTPAQTQTVPGLPAGEEIPLTWTFPAPTLSETEERALHVKADSTDVIPEPNEENNEGIGSVTILGEKPDLTVTSVKADAGSYKPYETVTIAVTVRNEGIISAPASSVRLTGESIPTQDMALPSLQPGASHAVSFRFSAPYIVGEQEYGLMAIADPDDMIVESDESNNQGEGSFIISNPLADLTVTEVRADREEYAEGENGSVTVTVKNQGARTVEEAMLRLTLGDFFSETLPAGGIDAGESVEVTFPFVAPETLERLTVTAIATADPEDLIPESNEHNNTLSGSLTVKPILPDLAITATNATNWYAGMDIVVTATVENRTARDVPEVTVRLTIGETRYEEVIPLPGNASNLAVFRVTLPSTPGPVALRFIADPYNVLEEQDKENNDLDKAIEIVAVPSGTVLDPDLDALEEAYRQNGDAALPDTTNSDYHIWQEVRLENGDYVTKTFWAQLQTAFTVAPDPRIAYEDDPLRMESGFGVQAGLQTVLTSNYDRPEKLVGVQMAWVFSPETAYGQNAGCEGVFDALEAVSGAPGAESAVWQLAVNPWSESGSRLHYTPLWYPDGEYTLLSQAFYAWSPAGQMYWYDAASVNILGDMYDRVTAIEGR